MAGLHHVGDLPGPHDHLTDPTHRLGVGRRDRDRPQVVQDVLGGDRGRPDPGLGERQILGHARAQVMTHHQHVEVLGHRVRPCAAASDWSSPG